MDVVAADKAIQSGNGASEWEHKKSCLCYSSLSEQVARIDWMDEKNN